MPSQDDKEPPEDQVDDNTDLDDTVEKGDDGKKRKRADAQISISVTLTSTSADNELSHLKGSTQSCPILRKMATICRLTRSVWMLLFCLFVPGLSTAC